MKYIDSCKLKYEIERRNLSSYYTTAEDYEEELYDIIDSLQQESEIVELFFKDGTYRVNGEEHAFKGGKAKIIILEINQEEGNK